MIHAVGLCCLIKSNKIIPGMPIPLEHMFSVPDLAGSRPVAVDSGRWSLWANLSLFGFPFSREFLRLASNLSVFRGRNCIFSQDASVHPHYFTLTVPKMSTGARWQVTRDHGLLRRARQFVFVELANSFMSDLRHKMRINLRTNWNTFL